MQKLSAAREIAVELESSKSFREAGNVAVAVGATFLSAVPGLGGVGTAVDKLGGRLFDADLEPKFIKLCRLVADLQPDFDRISSLEERLDAVSALLTENKALEKHFEGLASGLQRDAEAFGIYTSEATQSFTNVVIENMRVNAEAHRGGINRFDQVETTGGSVNFTATSGGAQQVSNSVFKGSGGSVGMNQLQLGGQIRVDTNNGSAVSFGENGVIAFGPNGQLNFGAPPKTPRK